MECEDRTTEVVPLGISDVPDLAGVLRGATERRDEEHERLGTELLSCSRPLHIYPSSPHVVLPSMPIGTIRTLSAGPNE